ncbi:MAG: tetratricopeptide repeat protein [Paludibacter sp.]|nr:tetratricopeptide repeat protein [Bacteroidales bacterium]MCM1069047.1 tetratricopeptide repeat protein [Prevotella sp.]MCM1354696.1 tetratricopeptide repeat protein [Bacteroides sp.]MCM1443538.1 tetratricopeptide repeat protein [Muribaculum sp.]MCM1481603.1 tetratricopeptide repeat protein [Paludibacter sp.]
MKKIVLTAAIVLAGTMCFAQKSNVNKAKNLAANTESPDFVGAREAIALALQDESTKDLADTWYQAGLIGYKENEYLFAQSALGAIDEQKKGEAVAESYNYWITADELSLLPNAKGKVSTKLHNSITNKMLEYYTQQELIKYGIYLNDKKDFKRAYEIFKMHLDMPDLAMMQEEKLQAKMPKDTIYLQYKYYLGLFATQAEMHKEAIEVFEQMKNGDYEPVYINQFLYQEYVALNDTANFVRVLQEATERFPGEAWFLQNLINYYIYSNQEAEALNYLAKAIEREPNVAQYYHIKGNLEENMGMYDEAINDFNKALEVDPNLADAEAGLGRVFYNQAVKLNEEAAYIQDNKTYQAKLKEMDAMFAKSLPFFLKAHEMAPDNRDYMIVLRQLYYRLKMDAEYEAINAELNSDF